MPVFRYPPRDLPSPTPTATSPSDGHKPPNAGLIAGVVTASAIVLFLLVVILVPIFKRRRQRSAPAATSVEEFLGKDSTFERQAPGDIAAILDHLSYLPQNGAAPKSATPGRRSLVLLGRRLSGQPGSAQRPSSIVYNTQPPSGRGQQPQSGRNRNQTPRNHTGRSGRNRRPESIQQQKDWEDYYEEEKEAQHSVPNMRDSPPLDEYAPSPVRSPFMVPASAPAAVSTSHNFSTRPLQVRSRTGNPHQRQHHHRDAASPATESDYSEESDDEYQNGYGSANAQRSQGKEKRQSISDKLKSRFSRDSFSLSAAPRPRNRAPPMSKSSGLSSPAPRGRGPVSNLESLPEIPNSSIAVGFSLPESPAGNAAPDSPDPYQHVPLTPRNVELPRTPRTPGSPLLREVLTPRTPYTPRTARRDISSPAMC